MRYDMTEFMGQCVDRYLELASGPCGDAALTKLKKVPTPFLSDSDTDPKGEDAKGRLSTIAASVLMKVLYAARVARFDLLKAVQSLACRVSRWTPWCDRALHRLM